MSHVDKKPAAPTTESSSKRESITTREGGETTGTVFPGLTALQRAIQTPSPRTLTPAVIQRLQRQYGNRFVTNLVQRVINPTTTHSVGTGTNEIRPASTEFSISDPTISPESPIQRRFKYAGKVPPPLPDKVERDEDEPTKRKTSKKGKVDISPSITENNKKTKTSSAKEVDVWHDPSSKPYELKAGETVSEGIKLTFAPLALEPFEYFIIPAEIGTHQYKEVTPDSIQYADAKGIDKNLVLQNLNKVTGYKTVSGKSAFTAIPKEDHQSEFHRTSSLSRVSIVPLKNSQGGELYKAGEIWVQEVKVSNDRPPTKFGGDGQRSHTVAWSLLRLALQGMANQSMATFLKILSDMVEDIELPTTSSKAKKAAQAVLTKLKTGMDQIGDSEKAAEIFFWQRLASDFLGQYIHVYQLSEAATYDDGQAVGHGEPGHLATLRDAESTLKSGKTITAFDPIALAAVGLLDLKKHLGTKIIAHIIHHWMNNLSLAFPLMVKNHHESLIAAVGKKLDIDELGFKELTKVFKKDPTQPLEAIKDKPITESVKMDEEMPTTALEKGSQSTFVANVYLVPQKSVAKEKMTVERQDKGKSKEKNILKVGYYKMGDLKIEQLQVADDRPHTRFGHLQRSHTVAWTLVRRHLINFSGKSAQELLNFIVNELPILQDDIDSPDDNQRIPFDAPKVAAKLHSDSLKIAANRYPLYQWQTRLSELIESYITLYQLSRSATYSKEERPTGHGESSAIGVLDKIELDLVNLSPKTKRKEYTDTKEEEICDAAIKLVDAAVATGTLQPKEWQIAIEHWLKLLEGKYPLLMAIPTAAKAIRESVKIAEPKEETLAGYKTGLTSRDKLLINLYESARFEARSAPDAFISDVQSSMRFWLAELNAPKTPAWANIVKNIKLTVAKLKPFAKYLKDYFARGIGRKSDPKDAPDEEAIAKVIEDVKNYFEAIKKAKTNLIEGLLKSIATQAQKEKTTLEFVKRDGLLIKAKLEGAFDEALELSALNTMDNFQAWYKIVHQIKSTEEVNYNNLMEVIKLERTKDK